MRRLLNTLYVTNPEAYLTKEGMCLVVSVKQQEMLKMPIVNLEGIVSFCYMGASPGLMKLCVDNGVALSLLSPSGQFIARIQGPTKGNVLLRKSQYAMSDNMDFALSLSRIMIGAKIHNFRTILQRFVRDYGIQDDIKSAINSMHIAKSRALSTESLESLRGIEGNAATEYFGVFDHLITQQKDFFKFYGRNKRPPRDEVNVMLSFVYTLITHEVIAALETVGLDPYVGYMHSLRPGRASLALDMVEELRAYLGDRLVISLINRKQITPKDFIRQADDMILLSDKGRKTIITAWQERKKEELLHPYLNEKVQIGLLPYIQAMLLARFIRGDLDNYPVFLLK